MQVHLLTLLTGVAAGGALFVSLADAADVKAQAPKAEAKIGLSEALSIGGPDAPEAAQFYEKFTGTQVAADAAGNIYVLDMGNTRVQVFAPDGALKRTVGSAGGGPGEFKLPNRFAVNATGMVAVYDMGQQRLSVFDATGKLSRDQVVGGMVEGMALADDGSLTVLYEPTRGIEAERFDPKGKSVWTVGAPKDMGGEVNVMKFGSPPAGTLVALHGNGGAVRALEGEYALNLLAASGSADGTWSRAYERVKFEMPSKKKGADGEPEHKMVFITVEDDGGEGGGDGPEVSWGDNSGTEISLDPEDLKKMMPEFRTDLRGVLAWPDGRIWAVTSQEKDDLVTMDEWSASGEYLRRLSVPKYDWYAVGHDGNLYGVSHDADDYPIVHRFTLTSSL